MNVGVQFRGSLGPNQTQRWYTWGWPASLYVVWTVVPDSAEPGAPEISYSVQVERASATAVTYWITITNLTSSTIMVEARYAIMP